MPVTKQQEVRRELCRGLLITALCAAAAALSVRGSAQHKATAKHKTVAPTSPLVTVGRLSFPRLPGWFASRSYSPSESTVHFDRKIGGGGFIVNVGSTLVELDPKRLKTADIEKQASTDPLRLRAPLAAGDRYISLPVVFAQFKGAPAYIMEDTKLFADGTVEWRRVMRFWAGGRASWVKVFLFVRRLTWAAMSQGRAVFNLVVNHMEVGKSTGVRPAR